MNHQRITAGLLTTLLTALLIWMVSQGLADIRTQILIGIGVVLGFLYAAFGRIPSLLLFLSSGWITADDDPSNISPRIYLPIIGGAILISVIAFVVVAFVL